MKRAAFDLKKELANLVQKSKDLELELNALVIGRPVRIKSDYNGQPYGRSRRSMRGQVKTVERAQIDPHWGMSLFLRDERVSIWEKEVEWL